MTGNKEKRRGSIVIFTLFVLALVMSISFAILAIFIPKLKIASESIGSTIAAYAADSAIEWCLYGNRYPLAPLPSPTISDNASYKIYDAAGVEVANCSAQPLNYRTVGSYGGVNRSFEVSEL